MDKSSALAWLAQLKLPAVVVPTFVALDVARWRVAPGDCLARARALGPLLAVRSDRAGEGEAHAGAWLSLLDVPARDAQALAAAIDRVIASYPGLRGDDRVLLQRQVRGARLAGVASSRAVPDGAPYRVTSFVAASANAAITGAGAHAWTAFDCGKELRGRWRVLRETLARTLAALVAASRREVEIEWLWQRGRLHVVQVRALTLPAVATTRFRAARSRADRALKRAGVDGGEVLAWMPDWNPAELLGEHPRPLARSLFGALVSDRSWSEARAALGYAAVAGRLLQPVAGRPYVRVDRSLASWLPASLAPAQRAHIVARQLARLRAHPELHDRVEFEVAVSAFEFGSDWRIRAGQWSATLLQDWRSALLAQAPRLYATAPLEAHAERARFALRGERNWPRTESIADWLRALERLRRQWALAFAMSARQCFAYEALLRSAQRLGAIGADELAQWRAAAACEGEDPIADWRASLRPGTFEIASPSARERGLAARATQRHPRPQLRPRTRAALDALCREHGLALDSAALQSGFLCAHRARDLGKAVLSVELSAALDALAGLGAGRGFGASELSWLELADLRGRKPGAWRERIGARQRRHAQDALLRMPALIDRNTHLDQILVPPGRPCYLGRGRVLGPVQWVGLDTRPAQLAAGAILLLERCEPGFDWVFGCRPSALVAAFGGPNAHVALRAHETGLPALLGVGPEALRRMAAQPGLEIDFDAGWWRAGRLEARRSA